MPPLRLQFYIYTNTLLCLYSQAESRCEAIQEFRQPVEGRSALLISHRFSTVRMGDYLCVLDFEMQAQHCK